MNKEQKRMIQEGLDNSMFGINSGPFYTLEQFLWFPDGEHGSKRFNMNGFAQVHERNLEWAKSPKRGDGYPIKMELWLHKESTLIIAEKPKHDPDEDILLWEWELK